MQPKTEELLYLLLWTTEVLARPTFRNLTESYESWAYSHGLLRQVACLERRQLIERDRTRPEDRLYRLTWRGRLHALGGRDPEAQWSRKWDGRWRLVLFDVPVARNSDRKKLRRYLHEKCFGYLQNSVWITPDPLTEERRLLSGGEVNVESLILLEARSCAGESDIDIVTGAWDFEHINRRYDRHLNLLSERPVVAFHGEANARALLRWAAAERGAWLDAVTIDPLLPERILPPGYRGRQAWRQRITVLRKVGRQLRGFKVSL